MVKVTGKVALALANNRATRGVAKGAFEAVNAPLSLAVHKGLGNIHKGTHDWVSKQLNRIGFRVCFVAGTPTCGAV